jgi:hypothetical protein
MTQGVTLELTRPNSIRFESCDLIDRKKNLISLTYKSLREEFEIVQNDADYSQACTSWLPVKAYYLLFYAMMTVDYLIELKPEAFEIAHEKCVGRFTELLRDQRIRFSEPKLNEIFYRLILDHREASGANLRLHAAGDQFFKLAMKKAARYKFEEWKRRKKIRSFKGRANQLEKEKYLRDFKLSIFEFPYYMRLRANYRDFSFIEGATAAETAEYFRQYYQFARNLFLAFCHLKNQLAAARTGRASFGA